MADLDVTIFEEWRAIPSLSSLYEASSLGRVRRRPGTSRFPRVALSEKDNGAGYLLVRVSVEGLCSLKYAHRLVCEAFNGPPPAGFEVSHLNGIRSDNRPANLEWASHTQNNRMKVQHGTNFAGIAGSKLNRDAYLRGSAEIIGRLRRGEAVKPLAREYGRSPRHVRRLRREHVDT